jgi:hypothetical protein
MSAPIGRDAAASDRHDLRAVSPMSLIPLPHECGYSLSSRDSTFGSTLLCARLSGAGGGGRHGPETSGRSGTRSKRRPLGMRPPAYADQQSLRTPASRRTEPRCLNLWPDG